jgi:glycosyltransferase involved in cell wall biosynthesis
MKVATNIFNSPANTGPGNFGRRLAVALSSLGIEMLPSAMIANPDVFLGSAFLDGYRGNAKATILRLDGPGHPQEQQRVKEAHMSAGTIIYQSEYSRKTLQAQHNYIPTQSYIINNGIILPDNDIGHKNLLDINAISICHNWNAVRYEYFYRAIFDNLSDITFHFPTFRWTIVGNYQEFKDAMSFSSIVHPDIVDKHIRFIQFTPDLDALRKEAMLCIHTRGGDPCPNSMIESLSYGLPCITWHDSAGPELINYDQAGIVLNAVHSKEIVDAIRKIRDNYTYYAQNARRLTEEKFDINVVAKQYAEVFHAAT